MSFSVQDNGHVAACAPSNATTELASPEAASIVAFVGRFMAARGQAEDDRGPAGLVHRGDLAPPGSSRGRTRALARLGSRTSSAAPARPVRIERIEVSGLHG